MAECNWCHKDKDKVDKCTWNKEVEFPNGEVLPAIPYHDDDNGRCGCGVLPGENHHPGCGGEKCPKCGGQLISCGCLDDEDPEDYF